MTATLVTLTGTYNEVDGTASAGSLTFELSVPITNAGVIFNALPTEVVLDDTGHFSQVLVANDDTAVDSLYTVTEKIKGAPERDYCIVIPHAAVDGTVDISTLLPNTARGIG